MKIDPKLVDSWLTIDAWKTIHNVSLWINKSEKRNIENRKCYQINELVENFDFDFSIVTDDIAKEIKQVITDRIGNYKRMIGTDMGFDEIWLLSPAFCSLVLVDSDYLEAINVQGIIKKIKDDNDFGKDIFEKDYKFNIKFLDMIAFHISV